MGAMHTAATSLYLAASSKPSSSNPAVFYVFIVLIFVAMYFLMIRPQRNRQRQMAQKQSTVMPGSRVRTTSGVYGTVISGDDVDVVVEIAPGVHVKMLRRAIMDVLSDEEASQHMGGDPFGGEEFTADEFDAGHPDGETERHEDDASPDDFGFKNTKD